MKRLVVPTVCIVVDGSLFEYEDFISYSEDFIHICGREFRKSKQGFFHAMRIVIQRVKHAKVTVNNEVVGHIELGLLILVGVTHTDTEADADWLASKAVQLRIFNDLDGKMNLSLSDVRGSVLVVSQFTLYASTRKGNRPSYTASAEPQMAKRLYEYFVQKIEILTGSRVETGIFGAMMDVELVNDGPVTILIDSKNRE